jgi:uncharacterized damage-inducible protein DinB
MHVSVDTLRTHIDYTVWASRRLLDAAASLSPEELTRDFGTADRSVVGTLLHTYGADLVWIERMYGTSLTSRPYGDNASIAILQAEWPRVWDRWQKYASALTEATAEAEIAYSTFKGVPYRTPVWQIVLHVVNHGSHHRGQAAGFIRSLGKLPPVLDLIEYYRTAANL